MAHKCPKSQRTNKTTRISASINGLEIVVIRPAGTVKVARCLQRQVRAEWVAAMRKTMAQPESSARYRLRQQTVEPVFGIVKQPMGSRQFLLRGIDKAQGEWGLVILAYNCKRLHTTWQGHDRNIRGVLASHH